MTMRQSCYQIRHQKESEQDAPRRTYERKSTSPTNAANNLSMIVVSFTASLPCLFCQFAKGFTTVLSSSTQNKVDLGLDFLQKALRGRNIERFLDTQIRRDIIQHSVEPFTPCCDINRMSRVKLQLIDRLIVGVGRARVENVPFNVCFVRCW